MCCWSTAFSKHYSSCAYLIREARRPSTLLQEGWMRTGDLGTIDAQGYCNIVGRIKDMVIWGGENIYPR